MTILKTAGGGGEDGNLPNPTLRNKKISNSLTLN